MTSLEFTSLITAAANFIACEVPDDDTLQLIGASFTQLGDTLTTIGIHRSLCNK
ncbi:MAG: hypothetical protein FWC53_00630 [Firmicutes bacterium]|nr:hypothetical protein [Bacillota bacterium]